MSEIDVLLNDFYEIAHEQGLHTGRWEDEYSQEESAEMWFDFMISIANKYDIKTHSEEHYYEMYQEALDEDEMEEYNVLDEVATDLRDKVLKEIRRRITLIL